MSKAEIARGLGQRPWSKYKSERTFFDGQWFDSRKEAERWAELRIAERSGIIVNLERQQSFDLFACTIHKGALQRTPVKVGAYVADFCYQTNDGRSVVEDAKGFRTREYRLKKKLFEACYGLRIVET